MDRSNEKVAPPDQLLHTLFVNGKPLNLSEMLRRRTSNKIRHHSADRVEINQVLRVQTKINFRKNDFLPVPVRDDRQLMSSWIHNTNKTQLKTTVRKKPLERHTTLAIISLERNEDEDKNVVNHWVTKEQEKVLDRKTKSANDGQPNTAAFSNKQRPSTVPTNGKNYSILKSILHAEYEFSTKGSSREVDPDMGVNDGSPGPPDDDEGSPHHPQNELMSLCCNPFGYVRDHPLLKLTLIIILNGIFSIACAAAIIEIEHPAQTVRKTII